MSSPRLTGWRKWAARGVVMVFMPLAALAVLELGLRWFGFGYSTDFFTKLDEHKFTTNRRFGWQFMPRERATQPFPVALPARKEAGTLRVFILGESAAQGTPAPQFGFGRVLEAMLQQQFPERRIEIINAAMRGIDSHVVRLIARECAEHSPDLFLVYMGNNEMVGLHAPEPGRFNLTRSLRLIRGLQWLKTAKLAQLAERAAHGLRKKPAKSESQDMEFFRKRLLAADDPLRAAMIENFRANLSDIAASAREAGAQAVLSTVGANLLDFPPLGSLHKAGLSTEELARWEVTYRAGVEAETSGDQAKAIEHFRQASALDDHFAELHFRLARGYAATADFEKAREHFQLARDWDALQFRADSRLNQAVRGFASSDQYAKIKLVDVEEALAQASNTEHQIPGNRFFYEHVHLTFDGDYEVARTFFPTVATALGLVRTNATLPTRQECAEALGLTDWDDIGMRTAIARMTANPPFLDQLDHRSRQAATDAGLAQRTRAFTPEAMERARQEYRTTLTRRPNDWQIRYSFGNLLSEFGDHAEAVEQFTAVAQAQPEFLPVRMALGAALARRGKRLEAAAQFREILQREPGYQPAITALADLVRPKLR